MSEMFELGFHNDGEWDGAEYLNARSGADAGEPGAVPCCEKGPKPPAWVASASGHSGECEWYRFWFGDLDGDGAA